MINPYDIGYNILKIKREEEEKEKKKTEIQTKQMLQMQGYTEVILEKEENNDGERMDTAGSNLETNDKFDSKIDGRGTMLDGQSTMHDFARQTIKQEDSNSEKSIEIDSKLALKQFRKTLKSFSQVRTTSSPILKMINI